MLAIMRLLIERMHDALTHFDWAIILVYLAGIVGLGVAAGFLRRRGGEGSHYFLAGNTLTWPIIGLAMFAANISTVHLVSLAEAAYKYGLVFGNFEWMAGFTLILLSLFFADNQWIAWQGARIQLLNERLKLASLVFDFEAKYQTLEIATAKAGLKQ